LLTHFRSELFQTVKNAPEEKILVTHGTDTLIESAQYLQSKFQIGLLQKKKIIFTGSFLPQVFKERSLNFVNLYVLKYDQPLYGYLTRVNS